MRDNECFRSINFVLYDMYVFCGCFVILKYYEFCRFILVLFVNIFCVFLCCFVDIDVMIGIYFG